MGDLIIKLLKILTCDPELNDYMGLTKKQDRKLKEKQN